MLDDDGDDEIEIDEEEVVNYVIKNAQKDGVGKFEPEEITTCLIDICYIYKVV